MSDLSLSSAERSQSTLLPIGLISQKTTYTFLLYGRSSVVTPICIFAHRISKGTLTCGMYDFMRKISGGKHESTTLNISQLNRSLAFLFVLKFYQRPQKLNSRSKMVYVGHAKCLSLFGMA